MPYYIAGGLVLAYLAATAGSTANAATGAQQNMQFVDYSWVTMLPSTRALGQPSTPQSQAVIASLPPPPGVQAGSGRWVEYPGGLMAWQGASSQIPPGQEGNPIVTVWPNVPQGISVFQWVPNLGTLTKLNGYWVTLTHFTTEHPANLEANYTPGEVMKNYPAMHSTTPIPPPPGAAGTGTWHMVHPGYSVWLTATNANNGEQATQAYVDPALVQLYAAAAAPGTVPAPSPVPVGVTPPPSVAPATAAGFYPQHPRAHFGGVAGAYYPQQDAYGYPHQDFYGYGRAA